jgi:hypothetical protein
VQGWVAIVKDKSESVPAVMQAIYAAVTSLIDSFCEQYLNNEYVALCRKLAATLARKRPSPLLRGQPEIWACAIVYAIGSVNFLFDRTQKPSMPAEGLCEIFGVSKSSGANKARMIRDMFGMMPFDPHWCLPSRIDQNPLVWMLQVNGYMVDIRSMSREVQEIAYQKSLIPYIPADRQILPENKSQQFDSPERKG